MLGASNALTLTKIVHLSAFIVQKTTCNNKNNQAQSTTLTIEGSATTKIEQQQTVIAMTIKLLLFKCTAAA